MKGNWEEKAIKPKAILQGTYQDMPIDSLPLDIHDELVKRFCEGAAAAGDEFAKRLIESGCDPSSLPICSRYWFDEDSQSMKYECFPMREIYKNGETI